MKEAITPIAKYVLGVLGGAAAGQGLLREEEVTAAIGALITLLPILWSLVERWIKARQAASSTSCRPSPPSHDA